MIFLTDIYNGKVNCEKLHQSFAKIIPTDRNMLLLSTVELIYDNELLNEVEAKLLKHKWIEFEELAKNSDSIVEILKSLLEDEEIEYTKDKIIPYLKSVEHTNMELYLSSNKPIIDNYYEIKQLKSGAFGSVYLALNKRGIKVVIKKIKKISGNEEKEYNILNILKPECEKYFTCVIEAIDTYEYFYIVMEYDEGYVPLEDCIKDINNSFDKKIIDKLEIVSKIMVNLYEGVKDMHYAGVAHKDIKPDNILVDMITGDIKFIDFGISCQ